MLNNFFEGWYFKHQNKKETVSIIPGICSDKVFIQIITDENSFNIDFGKNSFSKINKNKNKFIKIDKNIFSFNNIKISINKLNLEIFGEINFYNLTPIKSSIMGPFRFLPMQCKHEIISMHHDLK
ncbi:MAG: hypothetical protein FWC41_06255 [Firmicutes bacterium]|nr:hypothetical protein [Bacillota bacterium]